MENTKKKIACNNKNGCGFTPDLICGDEKYVFCHYCGLAVPFKKITRDHKIPKSKGGTRAKENIVSACPTCNQDKGQLSYLDYLSYRYYTGKPLSLQARAELNKAGIPILV